MILTQPRCFLTALCIGSAFAVPLHADTVIETETAQLGKKGEWLISESVQLERAKDGSRTAFTLMQFEYGVTDRCELLIEPFFQEWVNPKGGKSFHGIGDLEITPSYMFVVDDEKSWIPAILLSCKVKVPMAKNRNIGSGRVDYQPYVIIGKKLGHWIFNANFGVDIVGTSKNDHDTLNQFIYDFEVEREITNKWSIFAEVFGNSRPAHLDVSTFAGAIATEYKFTEHFEAFVSVGYDTDYLFNVRPGFNIEY